MIAHISVLTLLAVVLVSMVDGSVNTTPSHTSSVELPFGKPLILQCNSTLGAKLVKWAKDDVDIEDMESRKDHKPLKNRIQWNKDEPNTLTVKNNDRQFERNLTGRYRCEFDNAESAEFDVIAKPHLTIESDGVKLSSASMNVVEGDKVNLVCKVNKDERTKILSINWFKYEGPDDTEEQSSYSMLAENERIKLTQPDSNEEMTLTINGAKFDDRAKYMCQIIYGDRSVIANAYILIRVKDKLAALWPFLGIVGEVIILCAVIFIYEKRRNKNDFDESETDNAADAGKSPQTTAKGQEVRQRK